MPKNKAPKAMRQASILKVKNKKTGKVDKAATKRVQTGTAQLNMRQTVDATQGSPQKFPKNSKFFGGRIVAKTHAKLKQVHSSSKERPRGK